MAQPAPSLPLPLAIITFDLARKWSIEFLSNENNGTYNSPFNDLLDHVQVINSTTNNIDIPHDLILPIIYQFSNNTSRAEDYDLKDLFLGALNTLQLCTEEQVVDAPTTLATLKNLITAISNFTHESLELIGRDAIETLRELNRRIQELDKDLVKLKVSATFFKAIFSMIAVGYDAAAVSWPVTTVAVQPLLHYCFDPLWDVVLEKPIIEKKKVLETIQLVTHSAIVEAGKIKDTVQGLKILVDDHGEDVVGHLEELEKTMAAAVAQVEMWGLDFRNLTQPLHAVTCQV